MTDLSKLSLNIKFWRVNKGDAIACDNYDLKGLHWLNSQNEVTPII